MALILPLNLEQWFINVFSGNVVIFVFVSVIVMSMMAAALKMPNIVFAVLLGLFAVVFSSLFPGLLILILVLVGYVIFLAIGNAFR